MKQPPLLLLHGFGQNGSIWRSVVERFVDRAVFTPDLRGHGSAATRRPIDAGHLITDVVELARNVDPPILVGYSMGGRLAMRAALAAQATFKGLVLISTSAGIENPEDRESRRRHDERLAAALEQSGHEAFNSLWHESAIWQGDPPEIMSAASNLRAETPAVDLAASLRGFGSGTVDDVWSDLAQLKLPTLILCGERDSAYRVQGARMQSLITGSTLETIPNSGHSLPLESPAEVAGAIERFSLRLPREES